MSKNDKSLPHYALNDRADLGRLAEELQNALDGLFAGRLGVKVGHGTFEPDGSAFRLKVDFLRIGEGGEVETREASDFRRYASQFGLSPDDLGAEFRGRDGDLYEIAGAKPRSRKYPILGRRVSDGRLYKFTDAFVATALAAKALNKAKGGAA